MNESEKKKNIEIMKKFPSTKTQHHQTGGLSHVISFPYY